MHKIPLFLFWTFLFSFSITSAQTKLDTIAASQHYKKADSLLSQKKYEKSITQFKKALPIYQNAKTWEKVASCYNKISENQWRNQKLEASFSNAKKALEISDQYLTKGNNYEAGAYHNIGNHYTLLPDYDQALTYLQKALTLRQQLFSEDHKDILMSYKDIGVVYSHIGNYKKALESYEKALAISLKTFGPNHSQTASVYSNLGAAYDDFGQYDKAIEYYKKDIIITIQVYGKNHINMGYSYINIGTAYFNLKDYDNALQNFQNSLPIFKKEKFLIGQIVAYLNLGSLYSKKGEYSKSLEYSEKSLNIALKSLGENHPYIGMIYNNIGIAFSNIDDQEKSIDYYNKALHVHKTVYGENHDHVAATYENIGVLYMDIQDYDNALMYFEKALKIRNTLFDKKNTTIASLYDYFGSLYSKKGAYDDALSYYQKELDILRHLYGNEHLTVVDSYVNIATVFYDQGAYSKSISYFDKALTANLRKEKDLKNNFEVDHYYDPKLLLKTLHGKAKTLQSLYQQTHQTNDLEQAINIFSKTDIVINTIRKSNQNYEDKVDFAEQTKEIYKNAINANLLYYTNTKQSIGLESVFYYMEKSKSNILKELLNDSFAKNFAELPEELITLEKTLKINSSFYRSQIVEEQSNALIDTLKIRDLESELFDINRRNDSLINVIEKEYSKYYQLKYQTSSVIVSDIQQQLDNKTTLLEFFTGDSITYAFTISKNEIAVKELATPKLTKQIEQFRKSITSKNIQEFKRQSHLLYKTLITPIKEQLKGNELIIVPDESLWHLNFELLLTQNDVSENPRELSYLLKDYAITYANSANLLFNPFKKVTSEDEKEGCLAFSFSDSTQVMASKSMSLATLRDAGDDLPGTRKEIRAIADIIDGQYYFGIEANEANFKKNVDRYQIVHLALHGEVDNEKPENSKLFFTKSKDTIEDNLLYAHELFALDIPSELTVLSACNTGTGKIAKGEGIMSLGNAFQYAGTKSLLLSSWEVPDNTVPELMQYFYTNLKKGMNKGKALQQAKLHYLNTADRYRKAPFYWGGFYLVGDSAPIQFSTSNYWYWILGFGVLGILLLGLFLYKRKRRS